MKRGAGRITRLEVRWWVISAVFGLAVSVVLVGRLLGTRVAEAVTVALLLTPTIWYLAAGVRGKWKAKSFPADASYLAGVSDIQPASDVPSGEVGGCD